MENERCSIQLINKDGVLNVKELENFIIQVKLRECGLSYRVVSIIGPRSSGKSTLLNHLFGTNFREMDASKGRSQTTKGIWLARGAGIEPCLLLMDLEGTDGSERGEDGTTFEKQRSLFALAVSDIVIINIWCHDIRREQATNKPLLKLVFQVMMRLCSPRQKTLLFVIRDKSKTPLEKLQSTLKEDVQKIWDSVAKPQAHKGSPLSKFFNVKIVALPNYEMERKQFKEQVANLKQKYFHSIAPGELTGNRDGVAPASGLSLSLQEIWKKIKKNKDLDLPALKVMVATVRCEEIAKQEYSNFAKDKQWLQLARKAYSEPVPSLGMKLRKVYDAYLLRYDEEAMYYDARVRSAKKRRLRKDLVQLMRPAFDSILEHLRTGTLDGFKEAFDRTLNGGEAFSSTAQSLRKSYMDKFEKRCADANIRLVYPSTSEARTKLRHDIDLRIASVRDDKLSKLTIKYKAKLTDALSGPVEDYLCKAGDGTWPKIQIRLTNATESVVSRVSNALSDLNLDKKSKEKILTKLREHAREVVEITAEKQAKRVLKYMIKRFKEKLVESLLGNSDRHIKIEARARAAQSDCLKLLSVMVAIRLDDKPDEIEGILFGTLLEPKTSGTRVDPLASSTWKKVLQKPPFKTLITPVKCKEVWAKFMTETDEFIRTLAACPQGNKGRRNDMIKVVVSVLEVAAKVASAIVSM